MYNYYVSYSPKEDNADGDLRGPYPWLTAKVIANEMKSEIAEGQKPEGIVTIVNQDGAVISQEYP